MTAGTTRDPVTVGPYRLLRKLGEGGMGVVHLALDPAGRAVAVKVLRPHVAHDEEARRRLGREVATLSRVRHPKIAEVLDADIVGDRPYLVTRFVPGRSLEDEVRDTGPLPAVQVARIGRDLADALVHLHAAGIVHRDLKPANVMLVDGEPILIDFGIAHAADDSRITRTGLVMGTPGYLSPELIYGGDVAPATDWWALGATLAFAATGRLPFGTGPVEVVLERVRRGSCDVDGVEPALRDLLRRLLTVDPAGRPTGLQVLSGLESVIAATRTAPSPGFPPPPPPVPWPSSAPVRPGLPPASVPSPASEVDTARQPPPAVTLRQPPPGAPADGRPAPADGRRASVDGRPLAATLRQPPPSAPPERPAAYPPVYPPTYGTSPYPPAPPGSAAPSGPAGPSGPAPAAPRGAPDGYSDGAPEDRAEDGGTGPRRVTGVLAAGMAALCLVAAVAPGAGVVVAVAFGVVARTVERSVSGLGRRRAELGRSRTDVAVTVAALPWRAVLATLTGLAAAVLPLLVSASMVFVAGSVGRDGRVGAADPSRPMPLILGMLAGIVTAWWGPGGLRLRLGTRTIARALTPNRRARAVVLGLCALVALAVLMVAAQSGGQPDWTPLSTPRLALTAHTVR